MSEPPTCYLCNRPMKITQVGRRGVSDPILVWSCACHKQEVEDKVESQQGPDPFGSKDGTLRPNTEGELYRHGSSN